MLRTAACAFLALALASCAVDGARAPDLGPGGPPTFELLVGGEVYCEAAGAPCAFAFPAMDLGEEAAFASFAIHNSSEEEIVLTRVAFPETTQEFRVLEAPSSIEPQRAGDLTLSMTPRASGLREGTFEIDGRGADSALSSTLTMSVSIEVSPL